MEPLWVVFLKGQTERKDIAFNTHLSSDPLGVLAAIYDGGDSVENDGECRWEYKREYHSQKVVW